MGKILDLIIAYTGDRSDDATLEMLEEVRKLEEESIDEKTEAVERAWREKYKKAFLTGDERKRREETEVVEEKTEYSELFKEEK